MLRFLQPALQGERTQVLPFSACRFQVEYQDESFKKCKQVYSGFVAQIIQHEIDHCNGIII